MDEWFKARLDWEDGMAMLSDEELGRLMRAIWRYARTHEVEVIEGPERLLYATYTGTLRRDEEARQELSSKRREVGMLGGRPRKERLTNEATEAIASLKTNSLPENQLVSEKPIGGNKKEDIRDKKYIYSPEPSSAQEEEPPVITIPLIDGTEYAVTETEVKKYQSLYPAVDVMQEYRGMVGWCIGNAKNRKTRKGIARFINSWLARAQDRARKNNPVSAPVDVDPYGGFGHL